MFEPLLFRCNIHGENIDASIRYESSDGLIFNRVDEEAEIIDFGTTMKWEDYEEFNSNIGKFMFASSNYFDGIYKYTLDVTDKNNISFVPISSISFDIENNSIVNIQYSKEDKKYPYKDIIDTVSTLLSSSIANVNFIIYEYNNSIKMLTLADSYDEPHLNFVYRETEYNNEIGSSSQDPIKVYDLDLDNKTATLVTTITPSSTVITGTSLYKVTGLDIPTRFYVGAVYKDQSSYESRLYEGSFTIISVHNNTKIDEYISYDPYSRDNKYLPDNNQLSVKASNELLPGVIAYGKNGIITGDNSVYNNINTIDYLNSLNNIEIGTVGKFVLSENILNGNGVVEKEIDNTINKYKSCVTHFKKVKMKNISEYVDRNHSQRGISNDGKYLVNINQSSLGADVEIFEIDTGNKIITYHITDTDNNLYNADYYTRYCNVFVKGNKLIFNVNITVPNNSSINKHIYTLIANLSTNTIESSYLMNNIATDIGTNFYYYDIYNYITNNGDIYSILVSNYFNKLYIVKNFTTVYKNTDNKNYRGNSYGYLIFNNDNMLCIPYFNNGFTLFNINNNTFTNIDYACGFMDPINHDLYVTNEVAYGQPRTLYKINNDGSLTEIMNLGLDESEGYVFNKSNDLILITSGYFNRYIVDESESDIIENCYSKDTTRFTNLSYNNDTIRRIIDFESNNYVSFYNYNYNEKIDTSSSNFLLPIKPDYYLLID